jgi:hypothetical protein
MGMTRLGKVSDGRLMALACAVLAPLSLILPVPTIAAPAPVKAEKPALKYYELRTYHAAPGKLPDVLDEFRSWIRPGLVKVGMTPVAFWSQEGEDNGAVVYLLAFANRADRDAAWERFRADPEINLGRSATTAKVAAGDGIRPIAKVDSVFMTMTDFSPQPRTADGRVLR